MVKGLEYGAEVVETAATRLEEEAGAQTDHCPLLTDDDADAEEAARTAVAVATDDEALQSYHSGPPKVGMTEVATDSCAEEMAMRGATARIDLVCMLCDWGFVFWIDSFGD